MTTYAPHHDTRRDARIREAWTAYQDRLVELHGAAYVAAEAESWEQLQIELADIAEAHAAATGSDVDPRG